MLRKFFTADAGQGFKGGHIGHDKNEKTTNELARRMEKTDSAIPPVQAGKEGEEDLGPGPGPLHEAIVNAKFGEEAHEKLRDFRKRVDSIFLTISEINRDAALSSTFASREFSLAITSFQTARQFLGKVLQERGATGEYKRGEVGERTDKGSVIPYGGILADKGAIEVFSMLRDEAQGIIVEFDIYASTSTPSTWTEDVCHSAVMQNLIGGKMWLGEAMAVVSERLKK